MNNLRIDLILPDERRSSSPIRLRFVLNIMGIVIGCIVVASLIRFVVDVQSTKRKAANIEEAVERSKKPLEKARKAVKDRDKVKAVLDQFRTLGKAHLPYRDFLTALREIVPAEVQLKKLDTAEDFSANARACKMSLSGIAQGADPKNDVDTLVLNLQSAGALTGIVSKASVVLGSFKPAGTTGEARNHRLFEITVELRPKQF